MVYKSDGSTDNTIEVGQGSLKLLYSTDEGKLTNYVNSRNMVCYVVDDLVSQCSILFCRRDFFFTLGYIAAQFALKTMIKKLNMGIIA